MVAGCVDLDDILRRLDAQERELATMKSLVDAMDKKISVQSYKELADKSGYELIMSNGSKIVLNHGAKGEKGKQGNPGQDGDANLSITEESGVVTIVYKGITYTLPKYVIKMTFTTAKAIGAKVELLIDAEEPDRANVWIDLNNNGVKDDGEAVTKFGSMGEYTLGSQTVTIYGKVTKLDCIENQITSLDVSKNSNLKFLACYENKIFGSNMTALVNNLPDRTGKEAGKFRVIAVGSGTEQNVINVTQAATAKSKNWSVQDHQGNPYTPPGDTPPGDLLNPLSLVAEYNVNPAGTGFVTDLTACKVSGYFTFDEAVTKFTPSITIGGKKYHLPSREEWCSIVPKNWRHVRFTETESYNDISETVTVQGTSITMSSDFRTGVEEVSYALRYKGTDLISAWRYEYISDGNDTHMKVTSRILKGQTDVTVDDIAKPAFWSANADDDVIRHFPASGFYRESSLYNVGMLGYFWSSSPYSSSNACNMSFWNGNASAISSFLRDYGLSVRLFSSGD